MGYSGGAYGTSPFGVAVAAQSTATPARVSTSRKIDPLTKQLVLTENGNGGFAGMTDACQRVLLLTLQVLAGRSGLILAEEQADTKLAIEQALAVMTDLQDPAIELLSVTVEDDGRDGQNTQVVFRDLSTGKIETVKPRNAA